MRLSVQGGGSVRRSLLWFVLASFVIIAPQLIAGLLGDVSPETASPSSYLAAAATEPAGDLADTAPSPEPRHTHGAPGEQPDDAPPLGVEGTVPANTAANRHQLTWFLADLDQTIAAFQPDGAPRDGDLGEAVRLVRQMSDEEVADLHRAMMPFMTSWTLADAPPVLGRPAADAAGPYTHAQTEDLEDLRARLLAYYDRFQPLTDVGAEADPNFEARLATLRLRIEGLTLDELAQFESVLTYVPTTETLLDVDPNALVEHAGGSPHHEGSELAGADSPQAPADVVIQDHIHPGCADTSFGPIVTAVLNSVANAAGDLIGIWSDDFMVGALATTNIPNIAKIVNIIIHYPLAVIAKIASTEQAFYMNCNEFLHQTLLEKHDGEMLEITDLISGTLTSIDEAHNARFDRVDAFHERYRESLVRLAIEEDLLRKGDKRVSLFQIPESLCITTGEHEVCGLLETAHDIVEETIETAKNLGLDTTEAEASFADGELQQGQGFYKEAYTRYREAYVLAVRAIP
jgi:hypothetical protein